MASGLRSRASGLGAQGLEFRVECLGLRVKGVASRV